MAKQMAGQYLVKAAQEILTRAARQDGQSNLTPRWIPGHKGIKGNEKADKEAKLAAKGKSSLLADLPKLLKKTLPISKTALSQACKAQIDHECTETHLASRRIDRIKEIDPSMPSGRYAKYAKFLPRRHAAILIQLRSGHIPLNMYLHRIGKISSPLCQECGRNETVFHYLIECQRYAAQRKKVEMKLKRDA